MLFCGRVTQLLLTWEKCNGNYIDRSSRFVFARRWGLGIFPLAQELAPFWCQEERYNRESATLKLARGARDVQSLRFLARGEAEGRFAGRRGMQISSEEATR